MIILQINDRFQNITHAPVPGLAPLAVAAE